LDSSLILEEIEKTFKPFRWVWRRLEYLSTLENWAKVFTDYGHIASSLEIWLKTLKERFTEKKILCVFQPHQMRRVLAWWDEFQKVIPQFDKAIIYSIYAAREPLELFKEEPLFVEHKFGSVREVWEFFAKWVGAEYYENFDELSKRVLELSDKDTIIAVFTAGDLDYHIRKLLKLC
jgi:UDP-N-acetylmuramate--alanine ligase